MTDTDDPATSVLELDDVFVALGHPRRRYLVYTLAKERRESTLRELASRIADWEHDGATEETPAEAVERIHASLYHSHVPKLAELGVLEYRESEDVVVRASNIEQVEAVLDGAGAELDSRHETHARER